MILNLILGVFTSAFTIFIVILLLSSGKYDSYIEPLDDEKFMLKAIYGAGFRLCEMFHVSYKSKMAKKLRKDAIILYGDKYAEYYVRVNYAQRVSFSVVLADLFLILGCMAEKNDRILFAVIGILVIAIMNYYFFTLMGEQIKENADKYLIQFPNVASTMALLVNAGMILVEAWEVVANSGEDELHKQMRVALDDMNSGMSVEMAIHRFGNRCATPEIRKFTAAVLQGMEKGNKDLAFSMKSMSQELWQSKKQRVLQMAELAGNKILIPILLMFVGILIMVMAPILTNMF